LERCASSGRYHNGSVAEVRFSPKGYQQWLREGEASFLAQKALLAKKSLVLSPRAQFNGCNAGFLRELGNLKHSGKIEKSRAEALRRREEKRREKIFKGIKGGNKGNKLYADSLIPPFPEPSPRLCVSARVSFLPLFTQGQMNPRIASI
jgi:hypothetical protein